MRKIKNYLIPLPKKVEEGEGVYRVAQFAGRVAIRLGEKCDLLASAKEVLGKKLHDLAAVTADGKRGDYKISVKCDPEDPVFENVESDEAYFVRTGKRETVLCGKTPAGAFYAAVTLAEMLESDDDGIILPEAEIFDYPDFKYRGHTLESRFGTEFINKQEYFDIIDYFAQTKVNRLVIVLYDCWGYQFDNDRSVYLYTPIPGHPEIKSPKRIKYYSAREGRWIYKKDLIPTMFKEDFFADVVAYGKKKNIVVVPQVNSLGHNFLIPEMIPEISAKNEDGSSKGAGYCTSDPKTYEFLYNWIDHIIDKYILPFGNDEIHLGLDEVGEVYRCYCKKCRDLTPTDIFLDHTIALIKHCKERGMKHVYICHDMFLSLDVVDIIKKRFVDAKVDDVTVIDWWTYEDPTAGLFFGKADKVSAMLRSRIKPYSGYQNWTVAQDCYENIRGCLKIAVERGFEGSDAYGTFDLSFDKNFRLIADVSWNHGEIDNVESFERRYAEKYYPKNRERAIVAFNAMRDIMKDEAHNHFQNRINRWLEAYNFCYRVKGNDENGNMTLSLKNFPGEPFDRLIRSDRVEIAYLELLRKNSAVAIDFFENSGRYDTINNNWLLTARHYNRIADEYLSVIGAWREYEDGGSPLAVVGVLDRLVNEREALMAFAETVKFRPCSFAYLRNMSYFRQYLVDLRDYFLREMKAGRRPKLDLTNLDYAMSDKFFFVR